MNTIKLSMIASLISVSIGVEQINDVINSSDNFLLRVANIEHNQVIVGDKVICVPGFPNLPDDAEDFGFKVFHGHARAFGFHEIKLIVLAYDSKQAQRLVDLFTAEYDKVVKIKKSIDDKAVSHMFEDDISPDEVINITNNSKTTYTLFNEQLFT